MNKPDNLNIKANLKTAIVHDWFANYAGSERVVESFTNIWKDSPVYTLADFLTPEERAIVLKDKRPVTSFIQNLPFSEKHYRSYFLFFPFAIEQFDLTSFDVVISSSHAVAKGVLTHPGQLHITYCHTPMRYVWDLYFQYLREAGLEKGLLSLFVKKALHYLRMWDATTANRPDYYIANSNHIAKRIKKIYNKDASVIYPPVDVNKYELQQDKENFYITVSRMVPYKKIDMIAEAFARMPDKKLVIIGDGPEMQKVKAKAASNIEILGYQPFEVKKKYMEKAKAFIFAAEEDFGIVVVEAMACGTPVIAWKSGGSTETVVDGETGLFFNQQTPASLIEAVKKFEETESRLNPVIIRNHSLQFSRGLFEEKIKIFVEEKINSHFAA